jgi:hypothetical protein
MTFTPRRSPCRHAFRPSRAAPRGSMLQPMSGWRAPPSSQPRGRLVAMGGLERDVVEWLLVERGRRAGDRRNQPHLPAVGLATHALLGAAEVEELMRCLGVVVRSACHHYAVVPRGATRKRQNQLSTRKAVAAPSPPAVAGSGRGDGRGLSGPGPRPCPTSIPVKAARSVAPLGRSTPPSVSRTPTDRSVSD